MRRERQRLLGACPSTTERFALLRSGRTVGRSVLLAALITLSACGLLAPPEPPAATVGTTGDPPVDAPIPTPPPPSNGTTTTTDGPGAPPFPGYTLTWHDEFNGSSLDTSSWTPLNELTRNTNQATPSAVSVRDGVLHLIAYSDSSGITKSGIVNTQGKRETTYGYYEARLRPSQSPGNWCSFWLNSPTIGVPIGDPGTAGVEIDVIEHRFENRDHYDLSNYTYMNLNWDGFTTDWKNDGRLTMLPGNGPIQNTWRTYAVLWTETGYVFYVDGVPLWKSSAAISNRSEYLVLSCEAQNNSWAGWIPPGGYGTRETSTTGLQVDWVRVWQKK